MAVPAGQPSHSSAEVAPGLENVPAGHSWHWESDVMVVRLEYLPGAQMCVQERADEELSLMLCTQKNPVEVLHIAPVAPQTQRASGLSGT